MLLDIEKNPFYYREIITTYKQLHNSPQVVSWYQKLLVLFVENQQYKEAESLALEAIESNPQSMPLYEILETIYTKWQSDKLCDLYTQIGQLQLQNQQIIQAEATFRKAFLCFHKIEHALSLALSLQKQKKISESVQTYYEAATLALIDNSPDIAHQCFVNIHQIDPRMQHLDLVQRMHLLTQNQIYQLQKEVQKLSQLTHTQLEHTHRRQRSFPPLFSPSNNQKSEPAAKKQRTKY